MNAYHISPKTPLFLVILALCALSSKPILAADHVPAVPNTPSDDRNSVPSLLKSATVYRNGAELLHTADAVLKQGANELAIEDVSNSVDVNSIRVSCSRSVTIMSVEFSREYLKPSIPSAQIKRLTDSVAQIRKEMEKIDVLIKTDNDLLALLGSNKKVGSEQSGLNVAELIRMMDYYKQKSLELRNELGVNQEKKDKLQNSIDRFLDQIAEEEKKNANTSGRILLQVLSPEPGRAQFTVSYLTPLAFWNPSYDLKVVNTNSPLQLVYKAKLVQTSGIDWKQVKLTLSTALPNAGRNAPVLSTWFVSLANPPAVGYGAGYFSRDQSQLNTIQSAPSALGYKKAYGFGSPGADKELRIRGTNTLSDTARPLYIVDGREMEVDELNSLNPNDIKNLDILKGAQATALYGSRAADGVLLITLKKDVGDYVSVKDNEMDVAFNIAIPYDVPGNGKEQSVELQQSTIPVNYKYYSAPRVDKQAYLLCEVSDWGKLNLLPGEANILFEGAYIGKSYIDPNSTKDTLNLTLGNDKRVVVSREKVVDYSSIKFLGSDKRQVFTYDLTVKNNKKDSVNFILKDQYPISTTKEIETELIDGGGATVNNETGILTWKLSLAPGESRKYRISYSEKYPRSRDVSSR